MNMGISLHTKGDGQCCFYRGLLEDFLRVKGKNAHSMVVWGSKMSQIRNNC
jgi:hypothetical protein